MTRSYEFLSIVWNCVYVMQQQQQQQALYAWLLQSITVLQKPLKI